MGVFSLISSEFTKLAASKAILFSVIGALLVPVIFGGILLSADWGPYDNLSNLPVAVVNDDEGAELNGEPMNVGDKLVESLKAKNSLGFEFVSSDEAMKGLEANDYYLVIVIPEDFSERATTVLGDNPTKLELKYIQNEGLNFLASKVTESATNQIREELANTITANYVATMFSSLEDVANGFKDASDGSAQLAEGTTQLLQGTNELNTSVTSKLTDISKLANGSKELKAGTGQLLSSLRGKSEDISKLSNGAQELHAGTGQLLSNLRGKSGDITNLSNGAQELHAGTVRLKNGTAEIMGHLKAAETGSLVLRTALETKLIPGSKSVSDGTAAVQAGAKDLHIGAQELVAGLDQYQQAVPLLQLDPNFQRIFKGAELLSTKLGELSTKTVPLAAGAKAISDGLAVDAKTGVVGLNEGLKQIVTGQSQIVSGASEVEAGAKQVAAGNASVSKGWTDLTKGATALNSGAKQVAAGNASVNKGWSDLTKGASALNSGAGQIYDGNKSVDEGWKTLAEGTTKLNEGASKVDAGTKELATGLKEGSEKTGGLNLAEENVNMFASPVELVGSKVNSYEFYRDSTAPYVLTLGLMVGVLIMSLFINFTKPQNVSSVNWFVAKFVKFAALSIAQALILSVFVLFGLELFREGLRVESVGNFIAYSIVVSVVFSAIVLFLASLGNFGRWLAIGFIVLQLSITGANLPIDMLPEEYRLGSIFLPFTYTIEGFKSVISLNGNIINVGALIAFFLIFTLLSLVVFIIRGRVTWFSQSQKQELSM